MRPLNGLVQQLTLRPVRAGDWVAIHEWASTEIACQYQPWGPNTVQDTQGFVDMAVAAWSQSPQDRYVWAAVDGGNVVGLGELHVRNRRWRQGELAYAVHTERWGTGVATSIGHQILEFAFERLDLHRVEGRCDPRNGASAAVLKKLGMRWEGRLRQTIELRDGWRDSEIFSILAEEYHLSR